MKAVIMTETGGPDVLQYIHMNDPIPTDTQVVVKVHACGACGHDVADRAGLTTIGLPTVLGHEIAGEIVEVGSAVRHFAVGDRVAGKQFHTCGHCAPCRSGRETDCAEKQFMYGGYADYVSLEADTLLLIPDHVDMKSASIVACAVGTCLQALDNVAHVKPGETVVITGAGGGLGLHAMQVASALGARVIGLTSSPQKIDLLKKHGADDVVVASEDIATQLLDLTSGVGPQVVLDNVGLPEVFSGCFKALGQRGRYVLTGQLERQKISLYPAFVFFKEAVITGSASTLMSTFIRSMDLVATGRVRAVTEEFHLSEAAAAHKAVGSSQVTGRAILIP